MKVFLINPLFTREINARTERYFVRAGSRWPSSYRKAKQSVGRYIPFPFYLAYSAALLEKDCISVRVLDCIAHNIRTEELLREIRDEEPALIVYETTTPTIREDLRLAAQIKEMTNPEIALSGPHVTAYPFETLEDHPAVDYVLLYEYELTLRELVRIHGQRASLKTIDGIAYRAADDAIRVQDSYRPIDPLDQLPFPSRHLFPSPKRPDMSIYWDGFCQHRPAIQMHSSRGCPFRCDFCLWIQVMYRDGKYRMFSPSRVVDEMEEAINRYGAREIYFDDDDFTVSKKHVLDISREIITRGLRTPWSCMGDAVVPDKEMIDAMADAGCVGMKFGVESASPEILKKLGKPVDLAHVRDVARWCGSRKIKTHATITFGLWEETRQSMEVSLSFVKDLDVDSVQFSITSPFPGTRYFSEMSRLGRIQALEWEKFDGSFSSVVKSPHLRNEEIQSFCNRAASRWLLHKLRQPSWSRRQLRYMYRLTRGQGLRGFTARLKRAREILWTW